MSLRAFHLFFIAVSVALSLFVGGWGVRESRWLLAVVFFVLGAALVVYGVRAAGKLREIER